MYASVEVDADGSDPISYWTQLLFLCSPFANDAALNENPVSSLSVTDLHFPFEDRVDFIFNDLLFEHQLLVNQEADDPQINDQIEVSNRTEEAEHVKENYPDHDYQKEKQQIPRKRPSKRDRHTKIKTAHGLRDRRMRLSLEVARRFFRLQDMLRFDKASKTIEWLLNQAKDEIERLERENNNVLTSSSAGVKNVSSTSECEGVSRLDEVTGTGTNNKQDEVKSSVLKQRRIKQSRKIFLKPRPKEVRAKARERARERTKEKIMRSNKFVLEDAMYSAEATNHKPQTFGEESHTSSQSNTSRSLDEMIKYEKRSFHGKEHPGASYGQSLATVSNRNSPFLSSILHNSETTQEHPFAELQYLHKSWEAYRIVNH